jgi:hypothetical protein
MIEPLAPEVPEAEVIRNSCPLLAVVDEPVMRAMKPPLADDEVPARRNIKPPDPLFPLPTVT